MLSASVGADVVVDEGGAEGVVDTSDATFTASSFEQATAVARPTVSDSTTASTRTREGTTSAWEPFAAMNDFLAMALSSLVADGVDDCRGWRRTCMARDLQATEFAQNHRVPVQREPRTRGE